MVASFIGYVGVAWLGSSVKAECRDCRPGVCFSQQSEVRATIHQTFDASNAKIISKTIEKGHEMEATTMQTSRAGYRENDYLVVRKSTIATADRAVPLTACSGNTSRGAAFLLHWTGRVKTSS